MMGGIRAMKENNRHMSEWVLARNACVLLGQRLGKCPLLGNVNEKNPISKGGLLCHIYLNKIQDSPFIHRASLAMSFVNARYYSTTPTHSSSRPDSLDCHGKLGARASAVVLPKFIYLAESRRRLPGAYC
jgi:hypothetical protein